MVEPRPAPPGSGAIRAELTADELIDKLCRSLKRDGDFPASAKVVTELKRLASDPRTTANQITEIILREPSLGARVLHIVNSSFYRRSTPIMTVSQAVVRIGMKQLAELCAGLVLLQKFVPAARKDGAFANCLRKTIITPLLTNALALEIQNNKKDTQNESGYLSGLFAELGILLLAYYFPQVYDAASKRAEQKKVDFSQALQEITGLTSLRISKAIIESLELPEFYLKVLTQSESTGTMKEIPALPNEQKNIYFTAQAVHAAGAIASVIATPSSKAQLDAVILKLKDRIQLDVKGLEKVVGRLPEIFKEHCQSIELDLPEMPAYMSSYAEKTESTGEPEVVSSEDNFSRFVDEIRQAVDNREPTASIITTVMETLAWGLSFDRVILLLVDPSKKLLRGRMLLGQIPNFDPKEFSRTVGVGADPNAPDAKAFSSGRAIFQGDPVLPDGWPLAAIPIGFGTHAIGIVYADRVNSDALELGAREQAAIGVLAELLDKSITMQRR